MRISNSFSEGEIQVLEFIIQTLLRGGTPSMATRHKEFASLCRKVMAMKAKVQEKEKSDKKKPGAKGPGIEPMDVAAEEPVTDPDTDADPDEPSQDDVVQVG
jgi:hypothetical protein